MWEELRLAALQALEGLRGILRALFGLPVRLARGISEAVLGHRVVAQSSDEPAAEKSAETASDAREHARDQRHDGRKILAAFLKAAYDKSLGHEPDPVHIEMMPAKLKAYLHALTTIECEKVAQRTLTEIRALLENRPTKMGVRCPAQAEADAEAAKENETPEPPADRSVRREQLREQLREAARKPRGEEDEVQASLARMGLSA